MTVIVEDRLSMENMYAPPTEYIDNIKVWYEDEEQEDGTTVQMRRIDSRARNTSEDFENKKVIVFSLPGAFTPTCTTLHVPQYDEMAPQFTDYGIDDIICVSVNDRYVMSYWWEFLGVKNLRYIADANGDFTAGMGMLMSFRAGFYGHRSWRYAMVVENGIIKKVFEEPGKKHDPIDDPYEVSSPENVLNWLKDQVA